MPFALLLIGFLAFVSAYKNTLNDLGGLLKGDFSGRGNFLYWIVALILVGGIGYYRPLQNTSRMLLVLILVVMILSDKGFFSQFVSALNAPPPAANPAAQGEGSASGGGSSSGGGGILSDAAGVAADAAKYAAILGF